MSDFGASRRLMHKNDYNRVFAEAKKLVTPHFIILYRNNTIGHARLGLALSKKMIAKSHDRNRVKRLLRETFRTNNKLPTVDIVVLARSGVAKVQNAIIIDNLGKAWNRLFDSCKT